MPFHFPAFWRLLIQSYAFMLNMNRWWCSLWSLHAVTLCMNHCMNKKNLDKTCNSKGWNRPSAVTLGGRIQEPLCIFPSLLDCMRIRLVNYVCNPTPSEGITALVRGGNDGFQGHCMIEKLNALQPARKAEWKIYWEGGRGEVSALWAI